MTKYIVPLTPDERIVDFNKFIDEFDFEYNLFINKQKKASGKRARKTLLLIAKLVRFIRKDIQNSLITMDKSVTATNARDKICPNC